MAKIILNPIGTSVGSNKNVFKTWLKNMEMLDEKLDKKRAVVKAGWGEKYQQRVRQKNKMTAWERVQLLADDDLCVFPLNTFVNDGVLFGDSENLKSSPSAGVITAFVKVQARWVMVIANDNTVASGSWWPNTPEKIIRAQDIALKLRLPVLYLVDCSGLFLPEQGRTFPGHYGAGHIFKKNSELSAAGVPQIAGVMGDCIAGGGYMPIISDKVYMTEQAYMVIAGAALIQGAKSQNLSSADIGGARVHVHLSNCADYRVPDDKTCIERMREEVATLSSSSVDFYRYGLSFAEPQYDTNELAGIVSSNHKDIYDIRQVIARLVDNSLFGEFAADVGLEVVTGVAKIAGLYVGIAANVQDLHSHPDDPETKRPGGILYRDGVAKLAAFSRACDDDGIPLIWLQDVAGFDVGVEAEKQGLLGYGSSLIYANSVRQTPMFTVLLRKASGAGYYAMAGMPYEPVVQLSTPITRLAVMDGATLAIGAFNSRLNDNFQIISEDQKERAQILTGMKDVSDRIEADMDPYKSARQMDTDEIVKLGELRSYLKCLVEASYQNQGSRRIKNPRIWSLHDLAILTQKKVNANNVKTTTKKADEDLVKKRKLVLGEGINSPLAGLLYWRSSPEAPEFIQIGSVVKPGDTVALIEVMKCFYPIKYESGPKRKVKKLCITEAQPVTSGQQILEFE